MRPMKGPATGCFIRNGSITVTWRFLTTCVEVFETSAVGGVNVGSVSPNFCFLQPFHTNVDQSAPVEVLRVNNRWGEKRILKEQMGKKGIKRENITLSAGLADKDLAKNSFQKKNNNICWINTIVREKCEKKGCITHSLEQAVQQTHSIRFRATCGKFLRVFSASPQRPYIASKHRIKWTEVSARSQFIRSQTVNVACMKKKEHMKERGTNRRKDVMAPSSVMHDRGMRGQQRCVLASTLL